LTENEHIEIEEREGFYLVFKLWQNRDKLPLSHSQLFLSAKTLPQARAYARKWFHGLPIILTRKVGE